MAWLLNQSSTGAEGLSTTSVNTSFGTLPANGTTIFVAAGAFNAGGGAITPTFTDNQGAGNTYTTDVLNYNSSNGLGIWLARCSNCTVTGGTFTITVGGFNATSYITAFARAYSGGRAASPEQSQNTRATGTAVDTTATSGATTKAGDLIISAFAYNSTVSSIVEADTNTVPSSGWVNAYTNLGATGKAISVNFVIASALVTPRYTQTISPSMAWAGLVAAYKPSKNTGVLYIS